MAYDKISVIGMGYIGLPTAAILALCGKIVVGVDVKVDVVDTINAGAIHIIEPALEGIVKKVVDEGLLRAKLTAEPSDAFIIAVPTPFLEGKKKENVPDLSFVRAAAEAISLVLKKGDLVILESTSPVGATEKLVEWLSAARPDLIFPVNGSSNADINIAYCPERVLPGQVVKELRENDRVIGGITPQCAAAAVSLYKTFVSGECIITNARTAEMVKLTENASRDLQIAFANELSIICDKLSIDVWELIDLANRHPRVNILQPGPGVGGHCIAVDPWFIVSENPEQAKLIRSAREINDHKAKWVLEKIESVLRDFLQVNGTVSKFNVTIAVYGITFKANIDDMRESPSKWIAEQISNFHQGKLLICEPNISALPKTLSNASLCSLKEAYEQADIHVLLVEHREFCDRPKGGKVVDLKGIWSRF